MFLSVGITVPLVKLWHSYTIPVPGSTRLYTLVIHIPFQCRNLPDYTPIVYIYHSSSGIYRIIHPSICITFQCRNLPDYTPYYIYTIPLQGSTRLYTLVSSAGIYQIIHPSIYVYLCSAGIYQIIHPSICIPFQCSGGI